MITVKIYSKPNCHLCDEAKTVLQTVRNQIPFELNEINIEADPDYYNLYKEQIPVIFINDQKAFKFKVTEKELRKRLQRVLQQSHK